MAKFIAWSADMKKILKTWATAMTGMRGFLERNKRFTATASIICFAFGLVLSHLIEPVGHRRSRKNALMHVGRHRGTLARPVSAFMFSNHALDNGTTVETLRFSEALIPIRNRDCNRCVPRAGSLSFCR
jgi:hypothetical protein